MSNALPYQVFQDRYKPCFELNLHVYQKRIVYEYVIEYNLHIIIVLYLAGYDTLHCLTV